MGEVEDHDVREDDVTVTLREAMAAARERDSIAREYVTDYAITFDLGAETIRRYWLDGARFSEAVVMAFLTILAAVPDTLIARKNGIAAAEAVSHRASVILEAGGSLSEPGRALLADLAEELGDVAHAFNPGTTADLVAAALFVVLTDGRSLADVPRSPLAGERTLGAHGVNVRGGDPATMDRGREQDGVRASGGKDTEVCGTPDSSAGDEPQSGEGRTRRPKGLDVGPFARPHSAESQQDDFVHSHACEHLESVQGGQTCELRAHAEYAVLAHVEADERPFGRLGVEQRREDIEARQRLRTDDDARGPGVEQSPRARGISEPRVHPCLRPELIAQFAQDLAAVAIAGDGVKIGDVQGTSAADAQEGARDAHGLRAVHDAAADGAVVLTLAAKPMHHAAAQQI